MLGMSWKFVSRQFERWTLRFRWKMWGFTLKKSKLGRDPHVDATQRKISKHQTEVDTSPWWWVPFSFLYDNSYWNKQGCFFFSLTYCTWNDDTQIVLRNTHRFERRSRGSCRGRKRLEGRLGGSAHRRGGLERRLSGRRLGALGCLYVVDITTFLKQKEERIHRVERSHRLCKNQLLQE